MSVFVKHHKVVTTEALAQSVVCASYRTYEIKMFLA